MFPLTNSSNRISLDSLRRLTFSTPMKEDKKILPCLSKVMRPLSNNLSYVALRRSPLSTLKRSLLELTAQGLMWLATSSFGWLIPVIMQCPWYFSKRILPNQILCLTMGSPVLPVLYKMPLLSSFLLLSLKPFPLRKPLPQPYPGNSPRYTEPAQPEINTAPLRPQTRI